MVKAKSGSNLSSELRLQQYLLEKMDVATERSDWKIQGSEMKMKSGDSRSQMSKRSLETRLNPSQFHVKHLKCLSLILYTFASVLFSDLSERASLNLHFLKCH